MFLQNGGEHDRRLYLCSVDMPISEQPEPDSGSSRESEKNRMLLPDKK
jgi:hypothetical protein